MGNSQSQGNGQLTQPQLHDQYVLKVEGGIRKTNEWCFLHTDIILHLTHTAITWSFVDTGAEPMENLPRDIYWRINLIYLSTWDNAESIQYWKIKKWIEQEDSEYDLGSNNCNDYAGRIFKKLQKECNCEGKGEIDYWLLTIQQALARLLNPKELASKSLKSSKSQSKK